ncbi:hypothetical protein HK102_011175, partial [Quaeritorhiza haematococci]
VVAGPLAVAVVDDVAALELTLPAAAFGHLDQHGRVDGQHEPLRVGVPIGEFAVAAAPQETVEAAAACVEPAVPVGGLAVAGLGVPEVAAALQVGPARPEHQDLAVGRQEHVRSLGDK